MPQTRAGLIRTGLVVDLMRAPWKAEVARARFRWPVLMQREVFDLYVAGDELENAGALDACERLRTILQAAARAATAAVASPATTFTVPSADGEMAQLNFSVRQFSDGPYMLISMPPLIRCIVVEDGVLRVEMRTREGIQRLIEQLLPGGVEGVPIPAPSSGVSVIGYCDARGIEHRRGANCYVLGLRHPIPGPLIIFALNGDDHGSFSDADAAEFGMRDLPGRRLPTLWVEGYEEGNEEGDPAATDSHRPGEPFEPPAAVILPVPDDFLP